MTSKTKLMLILLAFGMVLVTQLACGNDIDDIPDVGEETLDELVEDTVDAVETGVSTLGTLCTLVNGEGSDSCSGVSD